MAPPLGQRGTTLWSTTAATVRGDLGLALLEEACRIVDRLEQLDQILRGDTERWFRLTLDLTGDVYDIRITGALIEARQQAAVLRQLVAGLPLKEAAGDGDDGDGWLDGL